MNKRYVKINELIDKKETAILAIPKGEIDKKDLNEEIIKEKTLNVSKKDSENNIK